MKNLFCNNKIHWGILAVLLMGGVSIAVCFITKEKEGLGISITDEIYRSYDHYGLPYEDDESELYGILAEMLPLDRFEVSLETENLTYFVNEELNDLQKMTAQLPEAHYVRTIGYHEGRHGDEVLVRSYYINYLDVNGDRVNIEYHEDGLVIKTIGYIKDGMIVSVSNRMTKDVVYADMQEENPMFLTNQWQMVEGREFVNDDEWAGSGLYFQQVGNLGYCTVMIFGSGVAVVNHYTSPVSLDDQGLLHLQLPEQLSKGILEASSDNSKLVEVVLSVDANQVVLGNRIFEVSDGSWHYDGLQEMIMNGWFDGAENTGESSMVTEVGMFKLGVTSPMSQYSSLMSSVPGVPIETRCETDVVADDYEVEYSVDHGIFVVWNDGLIKQMGKTCTQPFTNHTVYWSPLGEDFVDHLDWQVIDLKIELVNKDTQVAVLSDKTHKIYQDNIFFALDQLPIPERHVNVIEEGLAVYGFNYEDVMPFGDAPGLAMKTEMIIDEAPIFTQEDLAYVDWADQAWYFTDVYLAGILKNWHSEPERLETVDTKKDDLMDIEGADLLGKHHQFVIVVDGESIYEGYFKPSMYSSFMPIGPVINDVDEEGIQITMTGIEGTKDLRYDERIKSVLERYDLLK